MNLDIVLFEPTMIRRFERIGVIGNVAQVLDLVRKGEQALVVDGHRLQLNSLRLQTFASSELCCSNPECKTKPEYFVIERTTDNDHPEFSKYHLNLYGTDYKGRETLFTHDHTLARALGGQDSRDNTTLMCGPCNFKKARGENKLVVQQREEKERLNDPEGYALREKIKAARQLKVATEKLNRLISAGEHFFQLPRTEVIAYANSQVSDAFVANNSAYANAGFTPQAYKWFARTMSEHFQVAKHKRMGL